MGYRALIGELAERFGDVKVLRPEQSEDNKWFIRVRLNHRIEANRVPIGAFGNTPTLAAERLLKMIQTVDD